MRVADSRRLIAAAKPRGWSQTVAGARGTSGSEHDIGVWVEFA